MKYKCQKTENQVDFLLKYDIRILHFIDRHNVIIEKLSKITKEELL